MVRATPPVKNDRIARRLATLDGASREAVEATIALWPLATRLYLAVEGIIDTSPDSEAAERGVSTDFSVTDHGMEVIHDCACWQGTHREMA